MQGLFAPFLAFVSYFLFLFLFGDPITLSGRDVSCEDEANEGTNDDRTANSGPRSGYRSGGSSCLPRGELFHNKRCYRDCEKQCSGPSQRPQDQVSNGAWW